MPLTDESDRNEAIMSHWPLIRAIARKYARSRDQADDLAQTGIARVLRGYGRYDGFRNLESWVQAVASRAMIDVLRATNAHRRRHPQNADLLPEIPERADRDGRREQRDALDHCLPLLRDDHRAVLALRRDGIKYDEVSRRTGLPVGTVKTRVSRAVGEVRRMVA